MATKRRSQNKPAAERSQAKIARDKERARARAAQDKIDRATLRQATKAGIYKGDPKTITDAKRRAARSLRAKWGDNLDPNKTIVVPMRRDLPTLRREAKREGYQATERAIFVPKDDGTKRASLQYERRTKEFTIVSVAEKEGANGTRVIKRRHPLIGDDATANHRRRFIREAKKLGPLAQDERLVYRVTENEEGGYSQNIYDASSAHEYEDDEEDEYDEHKEWAENIVDMMLKDMFGRYQWKRSKDQRDFMATVTVEKMTIRRHREEMLKRDRRREQLERDRRRTRRAGKNDTRRSKG